MSQHMSDFVKKTREHFDMLCDSALSTLHPGEELNVSLNAEESLFVRFNGNRVRKARTKMASALVENISTGEKPRRRARTRVIPIKTAVTMKFGHALSAH